MSALLFTGGSPSDGAPAWLDRSPTELAPYALVRLAALPYPPPPPPAHQFRVALGNLMSLRRRLAVLAPEVGDALYDSAAGHSAEFHRRVVLPLRRDVFNGRSPRPALLATLGDLPRRVPELAEWLAVTADVARVRAELAGATPSALAAERLALAALCRADELRRAVVLVGSDLLRGIDHVARAGAEPTARARKAEANALRYALRTTAKTSPLSWFTHVAWGEWTDGRSGGDGGTPEGVAQVNRVLLTRLVDAVRTDPALRHRMRYRLAPATRVADGRVVYRRDRPSPMGDKMLAVQEEEVALALAGPLGLVLEATRAAAPAGAAYSDLVSALAAGLSGPVDRIGAAAARFVDQILSGGLLLPVDPAHPQDPAVMEAVPAWLERLGRPELAAGLREIDALTTTFGGLPADDRVTVLIRLREAWRAVYESAGAAWQDGAPLVEDVSLRRVIRLGGAHGRTAARALPRLTALAEIFDLYPLVRRMATDQFVARYGVGGQCHNAAQFASDMATVWTSAELVGQDGTIDEADPRSASLSPKVRQLAALRAAVTATIRAAAAPDADEVRVPDAALRQAERDMPEWMRARPSSYSYFVQAAESSSGTLLALNHIYAGWGRFTSRFLDQVAPAAREAVAAQIRRTFGPVARVAQFRPVVGFNANLHPLLVADEIGEDRSWCTVAADDVSLYHDPHRDQVRLRLASSDVPLDVLYLGFLVPLAMPDRLAPFHFDLGSGLVDLGHLPTGRRVGEATFRPRLRYGDVVIVRRSWRLPAAVAAALRAELDGDDDVPVDTVARWVARLGLPEHVFVSSADAGPTDAQEAFRRYLSHPKPQYVDLTNALHLRHLSKLLARHADDVRIEEALPVPGNGNPGGRVVELVTETYRMGMSDE